MKRAFMSGILSVLARALIAQTKITPRKVKTGLGQPTRTWKT